MQTHVYRWGAWVYRSKNVTALIVLSAYLSGVPSLAE